MQAMKRKREESATSSADVSPTSTPCGTPLSGAPKYGTVIPNRIFVGGIAANTTEVELKQFFATYGAVKDAKIIADRAGVSKGYGFITFENQEDADRIIKKEVNVESDNIVFRDRKLNIGPAIRKQQVLSRAFDSPSSPTVMFSNGVPYTYQNGMAIFASPEAGYAGIQPAQPQTALMVPQTPPMYVQPQYATYSMPTYASYSQTSPQWATTAAVAAATANQWRYMTQSPTQALTAAAAANPYMLAMQPELMYAQMPQYQQTDLDSSVLEGTTGVEGSISQVEQVTSPPLAPSNLHTLHATEVSTYPGTACCSIPATLAMQSAPPSVVDSIVDLSYCNPVRPATNYTTSISSAAAAAAANAYTPVSTKSATQSTPAIKGASSLTNLTYAPYQKPVSLGRRTYTSPTFLIRNGNKVQCVMFPPRNMSAAAPAGQMALVSRQLDGPPSQAAV